MCAVYHNNEPFLNNGDPSTSSSFVPLRSDARSFEGLRRTPIRITIYTFFSNKYFPQSGNIFHDGTYTTYTTMTSLLILRHNT